MVMSGWACTAARRIFGRGVSHHPMLAATDEARVCSTPTPKPVLLVRAIATV